MKRTLAHILIVGAVVAVYLFDGFAPLDRGLASLRFQLLARPASGNIVVVGIDNRSLRELNVWPWPREYHAALLDRLLDAGAERVALDIDFSSNSNPASDAAFEKALRRAGDRAILATFKQLARDESGNDVFVYTAPIERLARHARLGHVNVQVESDSLVWRYTTFEEIDSIRLPGMATLLGKAEGTDTRSFTIDYAILAETLPYISYADVLRGNFDPAFFAGKTVIVGATALELGDRIPVPVEFVLPGPIVQALVADTIVQNRGLDRFDPMLVALIATLVGAASAWPIDRWSWKRGGLLVLGTGGAVASASLGIQASLPILFDVAPIALTPVGLYLASLVRSIDRLGIMFRRERMESMYRRAMMGAIDDSSFDGTAIADREGNIELVNPSAIQFLGRGEEELIGAPIRSVLPWSAEIEALYETDENGMKKATVVGPLELSLELRGEMLTIELIVSSARLTL